ncbi:hypothetical protein SAMN05421594_3776 [Chryseobacterium oleae]|uniref:Uncharacterized protein n=1 Tax=Chryseobacterium oleae TaxID=491207 RepID=A0A1I5AYK5_CHROL|nr:hypothetical protein [Chryseobacterium oleae]SFN67441.1 hypothetical protein SAMN05421594_3776 [Chryseobacterium oleae]
MKQSFLSKRIVYILLFCYSALSSQKLTIINNNLGNVTVKNSNTEAILKDGNKKEFSGIIKRISIKGTRDLDKSLFIYLEPNEKLTITVEKDNAITYMGDQADIHKYLNEKLNVDTYGKMKDYLNISEKKELSSLKINSELFLTEVLKKVNLPNVILSPEDNNSTKKIKNHIKYNWLYTILSSVNNLKDKNFTREVIDYYYKKYIHSDITQYTCNSVFPYNVMGILIKNKDIIPDKFPIYPIVEHTDSDNINQYFPANCQKFYFIDKYRYLNHINDPQKNYYEKVLNEKFNDQ